MPSGTFCGLRPLLFGRKASRFEEVKSAHLPKSQKTEHKESKMERPRVSMGNFILMMELRKKIIIFRDVIDLPLREGSVSVNELVIGTLKDLHRFYPEIITRSQLSEIKRRTINKVLIQFCEALKTIGDSWMMNSEWMDKATLNMYNNNEHHNSERIVEIAMATLDCMIKIPKETFDTMDEDEDEEEEDQISYSPQNSAFNKLSARSYSGSNTSCCASPVTPTSVLPEYLGSPGLEAFANISGSSPLLRSLRVQALGKLNPIDIKRLSFHMLSDMGSQAGGHVNQKNSVEDETTEEMEAKYKSLDQRNSGDDELMFEMATEASSIPEMREAVNLEDARSSTATTDTAKTITENLEATELLMPTPQVLPNAGAATSSKPTVSTEMIDVVGTSAPPPSTIISQRNDKMRLPSSQPSPPPPPPLPPSPIVWQNVASEKSPLPPTPPPPLPVLLVSVALETKSEPRLSILQLNVATNGTSMPPSRTITKAAMPPPPPPLPMKSGTLTMNPLPPTALSMQLGTSTIPPPPPPPPFTKLATIATAPKPPPPPPPSIKLGTTAIAPSPPPPFPVQVGSLQTAVLQPPAPSIQLGTLRTQPLPPPPPPPPPPSMQQATILKTPSLSPLPIQSGSQQTQRSPLPPPPPPPSPPMQPTIITTSAPSPRQMSMLAIAAPPLSLPPPPPPMMPSPMIILSSPPHPPRPPMISSNEPNATRGAPPPPPMMSSKGPNGIGAPPPPLPPMMPSNGGPPPPPSPMMSSNGTMPPPPPIPFGNGAATPPPPPGASRSLRPKKAQTKLKRSSQICNLYRVLKGKVEGGNQNCKSNNGRKGSAPFSAGGKQGMADALAEMTKRSAYFQQIEEDVQKYTKSILELKTSISNFQTKDMTELIKFHTHVESILENLADETQVLARFERFPQKKLESLRMAAALYSKLNVVIVELHNWKIEAPLGQLLERTERYFNKIKGEMDTLERTKDEESKKFQAHNIHFDFHILVQIKEAMVDVSSNCMELALKERREVTGQKTERKKACVKMLWRAFQFAFKVYSFAGGHDDRADKLTRELAHEIETDPQHQ